MQGLFFCCIWPFIFPACWRCCRTIYCCVYVVFGLPSFQSVRDAAGPFIVVFMLYSAFHLFSLLEMLPDHLLLCLCYIWPSIFSACWICCRTIYCCVYVIFGLPSFQPVGYAAGPFIVMFMLYLAFHLFSLLDLLPDHLLLCLCYIRPSIFPACWICCRTIYCYVYVIFGLPSFQPIGYAAGPFIVVFMLYLAFHLFSLLDMLPDHLLLCLCYIWPSIFSACWICCRTIYCCVYVIFGLPSFQPVGYAAGPFIVVFMLYLAFHLFSLLDMLADHLFCVYVIFGLPSFQPVGYAAGPFIVVFMLCLAFHLFSLLEVLADHLLLCLCCVWPCSFSACWRCCRTI